MKPIITTLCLTLGFFAANGCQHQDHDMHAHDHTDSTAVADTLPSTGTFGKTIDESGVITLASLDNMVSPGKEVTAKVEGEIVEVCQKKGCWMTLKKDDGSTIRVTFKDYGFFVPKDAAGKRAVLEGLAYYDSVSVKSLKHYAEEAGKSSDEIAKITKPEFKLAFEAEGVIIK
jgi:hypothetical protein